MPSSQTLRAALHGVQLNMDQWAAIFEEWRDDFKPWLDKITLEELGKVRCLPTGEVAALESVSPRKISVCASISTGYHDNPYTSIQGLFYRLFEADVDTRKTTGNVSCSQTNRIASQPRHVFGLTRADKWCLVTIQFRAVNKNPYPENGFDRYVCLPESVDIRMYNTVSRILEDTGYDPLYLLSELGRTWNAMVFAARQRLERLERVQHMHDKDLSVLAECLLHG